MWQPSTNALLVRAVISGGSNWHRCVPIRTFFLPKKVTVGDVIPTKPGAPCTKHEFYELVDKYGTVDFNEPKQFLINKRTSEKDHPNLIPSRRDYRLVGCVCEEDKANIVWWTIRTDQGPTQCDCGHWFKLIKIDLNPYQLQSELNEDAAIAQRYNDAIEKDS